MGGVTIWPPCQWRVSVSLSMVWHAVAVCVCHRGWYHSAHPPALHEKVSGQSHYIHREEVSFGVVLVTPLLPPL